MPNKHSVINFGTSIICGLLITGLVVWIAMENTTSAASSKQEDKDLIDNSSQVNSEETTANHAVQQVSVKSILTDEAGICLLTLNKNAGNSLSLTGTSSLLADGCDIHANSTASNGLSLTAKTKIRANNIFTTGGFSGDIDNFAPQPRPGSTSLDDPLSGLKQPQTGKCDQRNFIIKPGLNRLQPGVYCGGIVALSASQIELEPGIYVMKNGPLIIGNRSTLSGMNVGFFFTGNNSEFSFGVSTKINLTAPIEGEMAGILFYENREARVSRDFVLRSHKVEIIEGAIYLPKSRLVFDGANLTAAKSKWTAVIANKVELKHGAKVQLNSDYSGSEIPVPQGIWPSLQIAELAN